jgi:hypothetical protein
VVGDTLGEPVGVSVGVADTAGTSEGDTNIILIALSSGTGEMIFLPETKTPTTIDTKTRIPMITVTAASVRFRSSIALV